MSLLFDFVSVSGANWLFSVASLTCQTSSVTSAAKCFSFLFFFFSLDDEVQLHFPPLSVYNPTLVLFVQNKSALRVISLCKLNFNFTNDNYFFYVSSSACRRW